MQQRTRRSIFMLFMILSSVVCFAQNPYLDSLQAVLKTTKVDSSKANILNKLSEFNWQYGQFDTARYYADYALQVSIKSNYFNGIANAYNNIGILQDMQGQFKKSLKSHSTALKIRLAMNNKADAATSYFNIGRVYQFEGNYYEALKNQLEALALREEIKDKNGAAFSYRYISDLYLVNENYTDALQYSFNSLQLYNELNDKNGMAYSSNQIAKVYLLKKDYKIALKYLVFSLKTYNEVDNPRGISATYILIADVNEAQLNYKDAISNNFTALKIAQDINDQYTAAQCLSKMAKIYRLTGNHQMSLENLLSALAIFIEAGIWGDIANTYFNIGSAYWAMNDPATAKQWLNKALEMSLQMGSIESLNNIYYRLSDVETQLGNHQTALENYKKYIEYRDILYSQENTKKQTQIEMQYEFDKKETELKAEQDKKDAVATEKLRARNLQRNISIGGVVVLAFLAVIFLRQRQKISKEKKRSESLLLNILPYDTAQELKEKGHSDARTFEQVTVLFTDFKGFTDLSQTMSANDLVEELHTCFSEFDRICGKYQIEKIKTIGDAYMAVGGLPVVNTTHAKDVVKAALEIRDFMKGRMFGIRIGINTGSVVAGIVGLKKFQYDIWGDTVNTASRMESSGEVGKINISDTTYQIIHNEYNCEFRGEIDAKGKGKLKMYFLENK